jgi:hypothetical protein
MNVARRAADRSELVGLEYSGRTSVALCLRLFVIAGTENHSKEAGNTMFPTFYAPSMRIEAHKSSVPAYSDLVVGIGASNRNCELQMRVVFSSRQSLPRPISGEKPTSHY